MQLIKFFVVFVAFAGRICVSKIMIEINKPDGFAELEEAAIQILTTCYANQDTTILLTGDFPGNFIKRLSSHQTFSLILLDRRRRAETNRNHWWMLDNGRENWIKIDQSKRRKVHVVVTISQFHRRLEKNLYTYVDSPYNNPMASILILGWSSKNEHEGCDGKFKTFTFLESKILKIFVNANLMCRDRTKGIMMYGVNPFTNRAPEPWQFVTFANPWNQYFYFFEREYREHEGMCKNLNFDKTHDLGGSVIKTLYMYMYPETPKDLEENKVILSRRVAYQDKLRFGFINNFITYVNATREKVWIEIIVGKTESYDNYGIVTKPVQLRGVLDGHETYAYPHGVECKLLVTQFRGNMSQLRKILSIIDNYSWIGMVMAYVMTLTFFKYFLCQPLIVGILNLCRLTCNFGLTTIPTNVAPRIYLGCLFFFVLTMQGIFVGNLASLLTHDIPLPQVNTIQDVANFGYTVYAVSMDLIFFDDPVFKGHVIVRMPNEDCIAHVLRDPLIACLIWGAGDINYALVRDLHLSTDCITTEYVTNYIPWKWPMEEELNKFLGILISNGIMVSLDAMVDEKRLLEAEAEIHPLEPKVMTMSDLGFAFAILGIGLGCAVISFVVEIIICRFHNRVRTTRVIVLN